MRHSYIAGVIALGVALGISLASPPPARACSCIPPPPPAEALQSATAVFSGRVLSVRDTGAEGADAKRVELAVDRAWKGVMTSTVEVATAAGSASCGFEFVRGVSYLVYADALQGGVLGVSLCSRTAALADAGGDLAVLGQGTPISGAGYPPSGPVQRDQRPVPVAGGDDGCTTTRRVIGRDPAPLVPAAVLAFIIAVVAARVVRRRDH